MASTCVVKVYYSKSGQTEPEIRRFTINISAEHDVYRELSEKIALLYKEEDSNEFILQYIDDENERITFSSNEELRSAIELNRTGNNFKVFVVSKSTMIPEQDLSQTQSHEIPEEIQFESTTRFEPHNRGTRGNKATGFHSTPHGSMTPPPNHYHHHFHAHRANQHRRHVPPTLIPPSEFFQQVQAQIPQWLPRRDQTAHISNHVKQHLASIKTNTEHCMKNSKEYLENVGQYLQRALSPLGIDCEYRVDENANGASTTTTHMTKTTTSSESAVHHDDSERMETNSTKETSAGPKNEAAEAISVNRMDYDALVEDCLVQLRAMGFHDADGMLINLVRSKKGDINLVLDAIKSEPH